VLEFLKILYLDLKINLLGTIIITWKPEKKSKFLDRNHNNKLPIRQAKQKLSSVWYNYALPDAMFFQLRDVSKLR
jgi:hypothetical protein